MIELMLGVALAFIMFSLGLSLKPSDFNVALRQPKALIAGITCQIILLPIVAYFLILLFGLDGKVALGVMILSCCPGGITSNVMTRWGRGDVALSISYTALASILTVVTLPLIVGLTAQQFLPQQEISLGIGPLSARIFAIATLPAALGILVKSRRDHFANTIEISFSKIANILFAIILLFTLASQWGTFMDNVIVLGPTLLILNIVMLLIGCLVGQSLALSRPQVTTVAIESGFQNGTVGIVVGSLVSYPSVGSSLSQASLPSAVYGFLMLITIAPFVLWRRSLA